MLRRSQSYSSVHKVEIETEAEEEEDDGNYIVPEFDHKEKYSILRWNPGKNRKPMVNFAATCVLLGTPEDCFEEIKKYHLRYKFVKTECRLVRNIFSSHGFREAHPNSTQFNVMWTGSHLKPYTLRALSEFQKVNHFPRSYELTRKDRLYKNIQRMQHTKGFRHFDFIPQSFVLPSELNDFYAAFLKERGTWIVKPCASSRGRGIYLINHVNQLPLDETVLVCKYIHNPLLINAVSSYDPLRVYIYEEGLARFSTVKYEKGGRNLHNQWMHLTNYSVNKTSDDYIRCEDPEIEDYGSKWSFSAMLRYLKELGKDTEALLARIEDVIVKTIISGEMAIATACKMFVPHRGNCFELFGFDILLDENLKPWLLEVNLSPSLACDSPLDLKIKSNLVSDLFNLTGIVADDPTMKKPSKLIAETKKKQRMPSASYTSTELKNLAAKSINKFNDGLSNEERRVLRETKEEYKRKGNFLRVYPSPESWELYGTFQEHQTSFNQVIHSKLYPELWRSSQRPHSATYIARARNVSTINKRTISDESECSFTISGQNFHHRYLQYMRKLSSWSTFEQTTVPNDRVFDGMPSQPKSSSLTQGQLQDSQQSYEHGLLSKTHKTKKYETIDVKEFMKRGLHLDKFQAREAFAIYLQRVQHRLLQEISSSHDLMHNHVSMEDIEKQEQQIDLIHRFLLKAAVNLSNPINIIVPHKNLPLLERKKILARQLNDFVRVYTRETQLLSDKEDDTSDKIQGTDYAVDADSFQMFLAIASESELEETLTIYTRYNKSASIFLGAKPCKSAFKVITNSDAREDNVSRCGSEETVFSKRTLSHRASLDRLKSGKQHLKRTSSHDEFSVDKSGVQIVNETNRKPPSGKHILRPSILRPLSTGSNSLSVEAKPRQRQMSAGTRPLSSDSRINWSDAKLHERNSSVDSISRSHSAGRMRRHSSKQRLRTISTVCAYTGANDVLKHYQSLPNENRATTTNCKQQLSRPSSGQYADHVFGADDPQLKEALKKLSVKQSERTYSSNNIKTQYSSESKTSNVKQDIHVDRYYNDLRSSSDDVTNLEKFISYGDMFVRENEKNFKTDRQNYLHQTASTQTGETVGHSEKRKNSPHVEKRRIVYGVPRPPEGKKPVIKKQFSSQRMKKLVLKK